MLPNDDDNKLRTIVIIGGIILFMLFLMVSNFDLSDEELEQEQYCEMVRTHMRDKNMGWPDFNGNFKEVCEGEKK